jgi:hypothetical protein
MDWKVVVWGVLTRLIRCEYSELQRPLKRYFNRLQELMATPKNGSLITKVCTSY